MPSSPPGYTLGQLAQRYGISIWKVRRIYERGLLDPPPRIGAYRWVPARDLPRLEAALRAAGYLHDAEEPADATA
jgi:hypothetical protein